MLEEYTAESAEENESLKIDALMASYGQTMVEPGKNFHFDRSRLDPLIKGGGSELFYTGLEMLEEFVNLPIITDEMTHTDRRAFRDRLIVANPAYHDFLESNKIRWNHVGNMQPVLEVVHDYVKSTKLPEDTQREVEALADSCPKFDAASYAALSIAEKIAHVKRVEKIILDIFALLKPKTVH